jgi:hypothetical protein
MFVWHVRTYSLNPGITKKNPLKHGDYGSVFPKSTFVYNSQPFFVTKWQKNCIIKRLFNGESTQGT